MNKIKISVEYERPTEDRFTELLNAYELVKAETDAVVSYYKPLADAAEEAKAKCILDQLKNIEKHLRILKNITGFKTAEASCRNGNSNSNFTAVVNSYDEFIVYWRGQHFSLDAIKKYPRFYNGEMEDGYNIIGNWDKWGVYSKLEEMCIRDLKYEIQKQKERAENEKNRLKNITD